MKILHFLVIASAILLTGCAVSRNKASRQSTQKQMIFSEIPENIKKNYYKTQEFKCQTEGVVRVGSYDKYQYSFKKDEAPYCLAELKEGAMIVNAEFNPKTNAATNAMSVVAAPITALNRLFDKDERDEFNSQMREVGVYGKGDGDVKFVGDKHYFNPGNVRIEFPEPFADRVVYSVLLQITSIWRPKADKSDKRELNWVADEIRITYIPKSDFAKMSLEVMTKNNNPESNEKFLRTMLKADPSMFEEIKQAQNVKLPADSIIYSE
jgi:lipoprotein|nr:MAG TPA: adhesin [Caudoviricetes sp.]